MRFQALVKERKTLISRLKDLTGEKPRYTFVPRCAYEIGPYVVEKNGDLTVAEESMDMEIIQTLQNENLLGDLLEGYIEPKMRVIRREPDPVEEELPDVEEDASEQPQTSPAEEQPEEPQTIEEDKPSAEADNPFPLNLSVSVPMEGMEVGSLRNLLNLLYSRGSLLSKAVGGTFVVTEELLNQMEEAEPDCTADFLATFRNHCEGVKGITFTAEKVTLDGFIEVPDADHVSCFQRLTALMVQMAKTQKHIQAKEVRAENEKYAFRVWLLRLGMTGEQYKLDRKLLLENLSGHSAFRTPEDAEKAKQKHQKQKAKQAEGSENV